MGSTLLTVAGVFAKKLVIPIAVATEILSLKSVVGQLTLRSIDNNGGYVKIIDTYHNADSGITRVITGWTWPNLYGPYGSVSNVKYQPFTNDDTSRGIFD